MQHRARGIANSGTISDAASEAAASIHNSLLAVRAAVAYHAAAFSLCETDASESADAWDFPYECRIRG